MIKNYIVHIGTESVLIRDFIDFVNEVDGENSHLYFMWKKKNAHLMSSSQCIVLQKYSLFSLMLQPHFLWRFFKELSRADKNRLFPSIYARTRLSRRLRKGLHREIEFYRLTTPDCIRCIANGDCTPKCLISGFCEPGHNRSP